jgi:hypothetical protein
MEGCTALDLAVEMGKIEIIKVILGTPGIDTQKLLEIKNNDGYTVLHEAAKKYNRSDIIKAILETPGINKQKLLETKGKDSLIALHCAAIAGEEDAIKAILETPGVDKQKLLEMQRDNGDTALSCAVKGYRVNAVKILFEHQISTIGLRGDEKEAMNFLKLAELREILNIEFSDELGEANSEIRAERESLVLKSIHDHLKTYGTDQSWTSPKAWAASLSRMNSRVNALIGEMQDIGGIVGGVIVQKEIDKVMKQIMPKPQDQSAAIDNARIAPQGHQNQNVQIR